MKIILIEDDRDLRVLWEYIFVKTLNHDLKTFSGSSDFLIEHSLIKQADLIITDYHLDDLNGVEVAETVRSVYPDKVFFFFTGSGDDTVVNKIKKIPNTYLFLKPVEIDKVSNKIKELFPTKR